MNTGRYERQVQMLTDFGQVLLREFLVIVFDLSSLICEVLKNLVLVGVGDIIIFDNKIVDENDIIENFYTDKDMIGMLRSECVKKTFLEMNSEVNIHVITKSINYDDVFFDIDQVKSNKSRSIIITSGILKSSILDSLSDQIRGRNCLHCHIEAVGFYGAVYLDSLNHYYYDNETLFVSAYDLRIKNPFPEIASIYESLEIDDNILSFLYKMKIMFLKERKIEDLIPNKTNLNHFKAFIENYIRENVKYKSFYDKLDSSLFIWALSKGPFGYDEYNQELIQRYINIPEYMNNDDFWRILSGMKKFYLLHDEFPHTGEIPDFDCKTETYMKIKKCFEEKHKRDFSELMTLIEGHVDINNVKRFVKNWWKIGYFQSKSIRESIRNMSFDNTYGKKCYIPLVFLTLRFIKDKGEEIKTMNINKISEIMRYFVDTHVDDDIIIKMSEQLLLYGDTSFNSLISTISSFASTEIIKVATRKQIPIKSSLYFDGINNEFVCE